MHLFFFFFFLGKAVGFGFEDHLICIGRSGLRSNIYAYALDCMHGIWQIYYDVTPLVRKKRSWHKTLRLNIPQSSHRVFSDISSMCGIYKIVESIKQRLREVGIQLRDREKKRMGVSPFRKANSEVTISDCV